MKKFYGIVLSAAPFALLWVWQVNYAPDVGLLAVVLLNLLFLGHGLVEFADGYHRAYLRGRAAFFEFTAEVDTLLKEIKKGTSNDN